MQRPVKSLIVVPEMPATFEPRLDILPGSQRRLWPELDAVPSEFVLYGGTGLALQLGHRTSGDFDFFASSGFDPDHLRAQLPFFRDPDTADQEAWVHRTRQPRGVREPWRPGQGGIFRRAGHTPTSGRSAAAGRIA